MSKSREVSGKIIFCRNNWELSGNASESTRIALNVVPDADKWIVHISRDTFEARVICDGGKYGIFDS